MKTLKEKRQQLSEEIYNFIKEKERSAGEIVNKFGISHNDLKMILTHMDNKLIYETESADGYHVLYGVMTK